MKRFKVIPTPKDLWPFAVWDNHANYAKAHCNSRQSANECAAKYNEKWEAKLGEMEWHTD
jgi:hypothetical protein